MSCPTEAEARGKIPCELEAINPVQSSNWSTAWRTRVTGESELDRAIVASLVYWIERDV